MRTTIQRVPATVTIILATTLLWLLAALQARGISGTAWSPLGESTLLWGPAVLHDATGPLRGITALFMHVDIQHLLLNMVMLWFVGGATEIALGSARFLALYLAGGLASSAAILYFQPLTPTLGASGAIFALMAILIAIYHQKGLSLATPLTLLGINVVGTFLVSSISVAGHLGGLAGGAIIAGLYIQLSGNPRFLRALPWAMLGLFAVVYGIVVLTLAV